MYGVQFRGSHVCFGRCSIEIVLMAPSKQSKSVGFPLLCVHGKTPCSCIHTHTQTQKGPFKLALFLALSIVIINLAGIHILSSRGERKSISVHFESHELVNIQSRRSIKNAPSIVIVRAFLRRQGVCYGLVKATFQNGTTTEHSHGFHEFSPTSRHDSTRPRRNRFHLKDAVDQENKRRF